MKVFSQSIPKNKFLQWHQILCQTQGRYINNPIVIGDVVKVNYEPGNYLEQEKMWQTINTVILEKKPSLLKRVIQINWWNQRNLNMKSNIKLVLLAVVALTLSTPLFATSMRMTNGNACYPTEKTYFNMDGVTPFACASAGGPTYSFRVYIGERLLWAGKLVSTKPEVYFELPATSEVEKRLFPRLVVSRDLESDPTGKVVFFGEESLETISTYTSGGSSVEIPKMRKRGAVFKIPLEKGEWTIPVGKIDGAVIDQNDYRIVIRSE